MREPDTFEKGIRFGCGSLVGLAMGSAILFRWWFINEGYEWATFSIVLLAHMAICGWLATRFGDRYWERLKDWLWVWW